MLRKAVLWGIGLCCPIFLLGQGQTTNWYFGEGAGLRFNPDGSVAPLTDGQVQTFEGCATISDKLGNLLFYTDGIVIYDRNHDIMQNGDGLFGDPSSTQSAIIVPNPEDPNIYYVFSVDTAATQSSIDHGLHYSVVDLGLNGGLGVVVQKNIKLLDDSSEKIAAIIKSCFDRTLWVITMAAGDKETVYFDTVYAWEVTATGVGKFPVKSRFPELYIDDPRGYLKLSPDGTFLASANQTSGLYLFDFNLSSGMATSYRKLSLPEPNHNPYGLEFSPDGRYLYVHSTNELPATSTDHYSLLVQFDLSAADIQSSMVILDEGPIYRGALQLGENGKIYRTIANNYYEGTPYLGVIHNPNAAGTASDYQHNAIDLGRISNQGLPPFIQAFEGGKDLVINEDGTPSDYLSLCEGQSFTLEAENIPGAIYLWEKDGIPDPSITGFRYLVNNALPGDSGNYSVEVIPADPTKCPIVGNSTIEVLPRPNAQLDLIQCDYDLIDSQDGRTSIDLLAINSDPDLSFEFFESITDRDEGNPIPNPSAYMNAQAYSQTVYYRATNTLGCSNEGQLDINIEPGDIQPAAQGPVYSCDDTIIDDRLMSRFDLDFIAESYTPVNVTFFASVDDLANNVNALSGQLTTESTIIFVRKEDGGQCLGAESLELIVNRSPELSMEGAFALCKNTGDLLLNGPPGFNEFSWYEIINDEAISISNDPSVTITNAGEYQVEARINYGTNGSANSCAKRAVFKVTDSESARITEIIIKDFSTNNTVSVIVEGIGNYEYSLDGANFQEMPYFENVEPGIMTVFVRDKNGCGISEREITVLGYPKFFTPNGDGVNDFWQLTGVNNEFEPDAMIMIYDRYGSMVAQISPSGPGWSGKTDSHMFPASDYWFRVILRTGREFTGHFALKR